jgi:hypothetical protein
MLSCARGFGNVVARGYHLRVRLRRKSWEFGAPTGWKLTPQPPKNLRRRWHFHHADTLCPPQGKTLSPAPTRLPPLPTTPPDTPCAYDCVGGVYFALPPSRAITKKIDKHCIVARTLIPNRDSHFPSWEQRALWRGHWTSHNWRVPCSPLFAIASPRWEEAVDLSVLIFDEINWRAVTTPQRLQPPPTIQSPQHLCAAIY